MDDYEQRVAALQAEAQANLQHDLAAAAKADDPVRHDQQLFLMLLVRARLAKKLSQADLAAQIGMQQSAVARIESGRGNPGLKSLLAIAKVLDVQLVLE